MGAANATKSKARRPAGRKESSETREQNMRALAADVMHAAGIAVLGERKPMGQQFVDFESDSGSRCAAWVKCAWKPGKDGNAAVQIDFADEYEPTAEWAIRAVQEKVDRTIARGATHMLILGADADGTSISAAYLIDLNRIGAIYTKMVGVDPLLARNGVSPCLYIDGPAEKYAQVIGPLIAEASDLLDCARRKSPFQQTNYIILAQNEVSASPEYDWSDIEGELYHFPNQYRNRIVPGARFIYYRGSRRSVGGRQAPEYFGVGTIDNVYPDSATAAQPPSHRAWFAEIVDYQPFNEPVAFRDEEGILLETGLPDVSKNYWGTGARQIDATHFHKILQKAGFDEESDPHQNAHLNVGIPAVSRKSLLAIKKINVAGKGVAGGRQAPRRYSKRAKQIGDRAEELALNWLRRDLDSEDAREKIVWVASLGETPGFDISDKRNPVQHLAYEVKGTNGAGFSSIDLTANEWNAAQEYGEHYFLMLVANVESDNPTIQVIANPAALLSERRASIAPICYRFELVVPEEA